MKRFSPFACAALLALGAPTAAQGRVEAGSEYTKEQTFSTALRFLRVDRGYEVLEKDPEAAYLLFSYPLAGRAKPASGSVEVIETASGVRVFVQLPQLPEYHEVMLRDGLLKKLREEYGTPPPQKPPAKAPPEKKAPRTPAADPPAGTGAPPAY